MKPIPAPKRGRPRDPERLRRVLEAAAKQFTEQGFERTSVESVAQASGVSKMTVYSYFPSKEALFEACIEDRCTGVYDLFLDEQLDPHDPAGALRQVATLFLALMRADQVLAMHRMMFASAGIHPEMCQAFYEQGPRGLVEHFARYLAEATRQGALAIDDPSRAADQFLSMFLGRAHLQALLGLGKPSAAEDAQQISANVAMCLRAWAPLAAPAGPAEPAGPAGSDSTTPSATRYGAAE
jgi:TetR/AcrR family transcriptional repressor of mexJK operon